MDREELDNICIIYDTRSDSMTYSISEFIKSNRFLRNKITDGTVKIEKLQNNLMVIYTDKFKSVKNSLDG